MLIYLIQTILFQLLFLLGYEVLLKRETFFTWNRWYLLATPAVSLVLPLLRLPLLEEMVPTETVILLPEVVLGNSRTAVENQVMSSPTAPTASSINGWWMIYSMGALLSLLLFSIRFRKIQALLKNPLVGNMGKYKIREISNSNLAFSFYNTIFVGDRFQEKEINKILSHELVHAREKHSVDLLYFEILKIVFWFNPLVYLYQLRISTLHEFIADAGVVKTTEKRAYFEQLLNTAFSTEKIAFINPFFSHSLIKKRILMLNKKKSTPTAKFRFFAIVPLLAVMLSIVAYAGRTNIPVNLVPQTEQSGTSVLIEVEDLDNVTPAERERIDTAVEKLQVQRVYNKVRVTDGKKTIEMAIDPKTGEQKGSIYHNQTSLATNAPLTQEIPFAVVDKAPVFPGCEGQATEQANKDCITEKINQFVHANFDITAATPYGGAGQNRITVRFKIDENGEVTDVEARYPGPDEESRQQTEAEAERVVNSLPKMKPGKHEGRAIAVLYALPITF